MSALVQAVSEGFKQTDIGIIPEDWDAASLHEVCGFGGGTTPPRSQHDRYFVGGNNNWIKTTDLNNSLIDISEEQITDLAIAETGLKKHPIGSVLVAMYGGFNQIGRTGYITKPSTINQALVAVKPKPKKLHSYYLLSELNYNVDYWKGVASSSRKDPNITSNDVKNYKVALPPLEEQAAIANALSDVDALLTELENLIAKKQAIKTATMQQLLTGKTRLPQFATHTEGEKKGQIKGTKPSELGQIPEDWEVVHLWEIISFKNGAAHEDCIDEYGNFVLVNSKFVSTEGRVRKGASECRQAASKDDLLMVMSDVPNGKAIAKCFLVDQDNLYTVNQRICIVKPLDEMNPIFLLKILSRNPYYLAFDDGAKQTNLRRQDVLSCPLVKPSKQEQTAIATILSDMDEEIQTLEQRLKKTRQIKQGMMQELLTGKKRLPF